MTLIDDPNGEARSLMNKAPCVCNGEANGVQCRHYWAVAQKFRAQQADALRTGEKNRACTMTPGLVLEFTSDEKPTGCGRYEPRPAPGLVNIARRVINRALGRAPEEGAKGAVTPPKSTAGFVLFDASFEEFRPMTVEEIAKLREMFPDKPVTWSHGKDPRTLTASDIANGPQINMLKPGEQIPGSMSEETSKAVDGIFGGDDGGIFKK